MALFDGTRPPGRWIQAIVEWLRIPPVPAASGRSATRVTIAPDDGGRPGESFDAPARPVRRPRVDPELGTRLDAVVLLDRSAMLAVSCVGRVVVHDDALTRSRRRATEHGGISRPQDEPVARTTALGPTFVVGFRERGRRMVQWDVDHAGWAYTVLLRDQEDRSPEAFVAGPLAAAEGLLASWTWIDPPPVRVETPPHADGRPGHRFVAPGPSGYGPTDVRSGFRQDALVPLGHGVHLVVVSFGRLDEDFGEGPVRADRLPAPERARALLDDVALPDSGRRPMAELMTVGSPAGDGSRVAFAQGDTVVVDTHLDHGGWAFGVAVVGRLSRRQDAALLSALADDVLAAWTWLDAPDPDRQGTERAA